MLYIRSGRQVHMYLHMHARMCGRLRAPVACIPACVLGACLCMSAVSVRASGGATRPRDR